MDVEIADLDEIPTFCLLFFFTGERPLCENILQFDLERWRKMEEENKWTNQGLIGAINIRAA